MLLDSDAGQRLHRQQPLGVQVPAAEQGKIYERQNTEDFKRFTREGQYTLTVYESGKKPNEPGGW